MLYIQLLAGVLLALVLFQDLKSRAVHVVLFPLIFIAFVAFRLMQIPFQELLIDTSLNIGLIALNLGLATIYFSLKRKQLTVLTSGLIGWGDVLFFCCLTPLFSFSEFCLFFPASLVFALVCWLVVSVFRKDQLNKVPLAGLQALFVMGWLVVEFVR